MPINSTVFKVWGSDPGITLYSGTFNATTSTIISGGQGCRVTESASAPGTFTIQLPGVGTRNILYSSVRFLNNTSAAPSVDPFWSIRNDSSTGQVICFYSTPNVFSTGYKFYKREPDIAANTAYPEVTLWQAPGGMSSTMGVVRLHPGASLVADNANYASLLFRRRSSTGALISTITVTTQAAGAGSTGSWTAFDDVVLPGFVPLITYSAGDTETLEITKTGAGVVLPQLMLERQPAAFNPVDLTANQLVSFYIAVKNSSA